MPAPADAVRRDATNEAPPVDRSRLTSEVEAVLQAWRTDSEEALLALQVMVGRALTVGTDLSRAEHSRPGGTAYGLAHGAAGIIHTLRECSLDVDPLAEQRLADAVAPQAVPEPPGLYDGLAGVAWVQRRRGQDEVADELVDRILSSDLERLGSALYSGLPGLGLFLLSETGRSPFLLETADRISRTLRARRSGGTARPGLLEGDAGVALFALRLYLQTSDPAHLDLARECLDDALSACRWDNDGSLLSFDRHGVPSVGLSGSSGIGLVVTEFMAESLDLERFRPALDGFRTAACRHPVFRPGLFDGLAGVVHFLAALGRRGLGTPEVDAALEARVNGFARYALRLGTGIAFWGASGPAYDLATGAAGVLGALQTYGLARFDDTREGWDGLLPLLLA